MKVLMAVKMKNKVTLALTKKLEALNMSLDQRLVESDFQNSDADQNLANVNYCLLAHF
jgi:hypothetical protein